MTIDRDAVRRVIDLLAASQAGEIEVEDPERLIRVKRRDTAPVAAPVSAEAAPAADGEAPAPEPAEPVAAGPQESLQYVKAGLVGLFHHGRGPDDQPIVAEGYSVSKGQVIGTIEALRKLTDVVAPCDGEIAQVLVDDGEPVQYGDELFAIREEA